MVVAVVDDKGTQSDQQVKEKEEQLPWIDSAAAHQLCADPAWTPVVEYYLN